MTPEDLGRWAERQREVARQATRPDYPPVGRPLAWFTAGVATVTIAVLAVAVLRWALSTFTLTAIASFVGLWVLLALLIGPLLGAVIRDDGPNK